MWIVPADKQAELQLMSLQEPVTMAKLHIFTTPNVSNFHIKYIM